MKKMIIMALGLVLMAGCAHNNKKGEEARQNYVASLEDSIRATSAEIDSCRNAALTLSDKVGSLLNDFIAVSNPREVEGYTILNGWENRYPPQSTCVLARINASEQLELVAALKGGVFDRLRVSSADSSAETAVVPHDQALNYRREGLTTVMFSGAAADSVATLIAGSGNEPVTVTFLNGDKQSVQWTMTDDFARMIAMTAQLYNTRSEQTRLERRATMLSEKVKILRAHLPEIKDEKE